jgi:hypothetical protein
MKWWELALTLEHCLTLQGLDSQDTYFIVLQNASIIQSGLSSKQEPRQVRIRRMETFKPIKELGHVTLKATTYPMHETLSRLMCKRI